MYMAEKHRHPWVEKLDLSQIDLGKGKRRIVSGGELNLKYNITVPRKQGETTV
jgi:tRNA-binding EMAP/Myf-like protein